MASRSASSSKSIQACPRSSTCTHGWPVSMNRPPQPRMSSSVTAPQGIVFNLATTMLGRMYPCGHLDRIDADQLALVTEGLQVHRELRSAFPRSQPFWPWGLPDWEDSWIALGLRNGAEAVVTVWRRDDRQPSRRINLGQGVVGARIVYPAQTDAELHTADRSIDITLPRTLQAVAIAVSPRDDVLA
jgi:alpha-galactosidase